ncbi:MAG: acyl-CoA desaturase [Rubrivivax sp.]|nr:MAG: acyl-CoA desaturase [Rubrivivax sp.]
MNKPAFRAHRVGPRTEAEMLAFQHELDALRDDVNSRLGEVDARYVKTVLWIARGLESAGRALLILGGGFWPTWGVGTVLLMLSHLIETMELGHNIMHGQFNFMKDPRFEGKRYRWSFACLPEDWHEFHNHVHHHYANVVGRDRDFTYGGMLRMSADTPWLPVHLIQWLLVPMAACLFEWGIALHNLEQENEKRWNDPVTAKARWDRLWPRTRARLLFVARREYVLWPLLGGAVGGSWALLAGEPVGAAALSGWQAVLLGNVVAGVLRSFWAYWVIACGHFSTDIHAFDEADLKGESKGHWYLRQILSAGNFEGSVVLDVISGNASHQIEHHIYPDMPSNRYAEISPKVQAICGRYGVPYNTGSLPKQAAQVAWRIVRHSFPGGARNVIRLGPVLAQASPDSVDQPRAA